MYPTTSGTNKSPKICTDILRTQVVAVDASSIRRQLHEAPDDLLIPLFFLSTTHPWTNGRAMRTETPNPIRIFLGRSEEPRKMKREDPKSWKLGFCGGWGEIRK